MNDNFVSGAFMYKRSKVVKKSLFLKRLAFCILHTLALSYHVTFACLTAEISHISGHGYRKRKSFQGTVLNDQLKNQDFLREGEKNQSQHNAIE